MPSDCARPLVTHLECCFVPESHTWNINVNYFTKTDIVGLFKHLWIYNKLQNVMQCIFTVFPILCVFPRSAWHEKIIKLYKGTYSSCHQVACFEATERPPLPYYAALSHQYSFASFVASSELSSLPWAPLFVLQRCMILTILLWLWRMHFIWSVLLCSSVWRTTKVRQDFIFRFSECQLG
jgi:hypothetical protein